MIGMMYFDDMTEKYGFNNGETQPVGADVYREAYLRVVNYLLTVYDSNVRMIAWNRPGCHTHCMIINCSKHDFDKCTKAKRYDGTYDPSREIIATDAGYARALQAIEDTDTNVDNFVAVNVVLDRKGLDDLLVNHLGVNDVPNYEEDP